MAVKVKEVMSFPPQTVNLEASAREAGEVMRKLPRVGFLIVVRADGTPVGVLSEGDLVDKVIIPNLLPEQVKVKEIMSRRMVTVSPEEEVRVAVEKMRRNNIKQLPVVEEGKVVGVISLVDVAKTSSEAISLLEYRRLMKRRPVEIREELTSGVCDRCFHYSDMLRRLDDEWLCESCFEMAE